MGVAASKTGDAYSRQAAAAKEFSDKILTLFFSNANLMKLLKLHNIGECSKFVFTTSSELTTMFQRLQIYPKLGSKGEILFAPVSDLSPVLKDATPQEMAQVQEKIHSRNELCVDIGYFYVRIFQIYSALALTVIDTDPMRRRFAIKNPVKAYGAQKPQNAPLGGGGLTSGPIGSGPMFVQIASTQRGGSIAKTGPQKPLYESIMKTALGPLVGILKASLPLDSTNQIITFDDTRSGKTGVLYLRWTYPNSVDISLEGEFKKTTGERIPITLTAAKTMNGSFPQVSISISGAGNQIEQELKQSVSGWSFVYELGEGEGKTHEPYGFYDKIYTEFADQAQAQGQAPAGSASTGSGSASAGSATAFEGFEKLKKIFEDKTSKGTEFPKAYCIARLMTLINPVFGSELTNPSQPYTSQICRKTYDFETDSLMPRAGMAAKTNVYLRSFTSLFYDDYKYVRGTGKLDLTQTEPSRSSLRDASNKFAKLYNIPGDQPNFLSESGGAVNFTQFSICKDDKRIIIKSDKSGKEFLAKLQSQCVKPMLDFQSQHTIKVNKLLMKMFKIENNILRLQPAVKAGGKDAINKIGIEAHDLLLDYYLKSEAFYIRGVSLFGANPNAYATE